MPDAALRREPSVSPYKQRRGWLLLGGLFLALAVLRGISLLFDHSLHSIDGAMQTWFALDNFASGARLGDEFQSYLGITMILALLPGFLAFGQTLWASTFSAYAMVMAGGFTGAYAIVWMLRPVPKRQRWVIATLLIFLFYYAGRLGADAIGVSFPATFEPGVSLRPLRGALPFFMLPVFVWAVRRAFATNSALAIALFGLAAGAGLVWSNDAGIPLVVAGVIALVVALWGQWFMLIKALGAFVVGAATSALAIVMLVTRGDPSGWLQYNFVDIAGDQFWYFAPWSAETRILSITDLPRLFWSGEHLSSVSLIVLTVCVVIAVTRRVKGRGAPVRTSAFVLVGASLVGTALVPQIGGHIGPEYNAITFVMGMLAPLIVFQKTLLGFATRQMRSVPAKAAPVAGIAAALAMLLLDAGALAVTVQKTERTTYSDALGFYVTPQTAKDLAAMERLSQTLAERGFAEDERILSVYTSALDIAAGVKSPAPVGSLIHALGENNRSDFNALLFGKTIAVTTIAPDYSAWAGWNTRANWSFFKHLRELYRPVARSDQHILWVRAKETKRAQEAQCEITNWTFDSFGVTVTAPKSGLASVYLEREGFDASSRTALLTVTEDSPFTRSVTTPQWSDFPRYGIANSRIIEASAPVEVGAETRLTFEVLDGSAIGWAQCFASVYDPIDYSTLPSLSVGVDQLIEEAGG